MSHPDSAVSRKAYFEEFPRLETARCVLREATLAQAADLFRIRSQVEGARYGPDPWEDPQRAEQVIREWHKGFVDQEDIPWGIFFKEEDRFIGHIKYASIRQYLAMVGYHLDMAYWNQGIMTEVLAAVVDFLYTKTDAHRLQATVHKDHPVSMRVLEKMGFKREGLLRQRAFWHGKFCDLYMYALLRGEYKG
jgi:ribosomal-protein-alanine N-acetyltransferase